MKKTILAILVAITGISAQAEHKSYGSVFLNGVVRESPDYYSGAVIHAAVCNVNGPDGFVSVRSEPTTSARVNRNLKRLAFVNIDTAYRVGKWVYVETAYRQFSPDGYWFGYTKDLHVSGWVHTDHICSFVVAG